MSNQPSPSQGDVWFANLSPTEGREQRGDRPCLVVSVDEFNESGSELVIIAPLTTTIRQGIPWRVDTRPSEAGLNEPGQILCDQIRTVSLNRLRRHTGAVDDSTLRLVIDRLCILLGIY